MVDFRRCRIATSLLALALCVGLPTRIVRATQDELVPPTSGIYTGPQFSQKIGDAFRSLASCNKGSTAPANVDGAAVDGLCWIDDSATPWIIKRFVNGGWAIIGALDPSTSSYIGIVAGGAPASIDSATGPVIDLGSMPQANVTITGTSAITGFGSSAPAGIVKFIRFSGALTLANSAALAVPGGYDLVTAAGDRAIVTALGSGDWEITSYTRASGIPIDVSAVGKIFYTSAASPPALTLLGDGSAVSRATYPAYFDKVTRAQSGTLTSGNATITGVADTSGFGAGMPVEATGVAAGCTLASFVANTSITLNSPSCVTASGPATVRVFLTGYGAGGGSATVGLPDCEGREIAGYDPSGLRITAAGSGINGAIFNAAGGAQSYALARSDLPNVAPTATFVGSQGTATSTNTNIGVNTSATTTGGGDFPALTGNTVTNLFSTFTPAGSVTVQSLNGGVTQTAINKMPPTLIAPCVVRVTP